MPTRETLHAEDIYSWRRVWRTPIGIFIAVIMIILPVMSYVGLEFVQDTFDRRREFCTRSNIEAQRTRNLWNQVVIRAQSNDRKERAYVFVGNKKFPVVFEKDELTPEQAEEFRKLVASIYKIEKC